MVSSSSRQGRLGFCCKFIPVDGDAELARSMNMVGVTMAYLARQEPKGAHEKLLSVVSHNLAALRRQVAHVAERRPLERVHRMSSDLLPGYTHPAWRGFYREPEIRTLLETSLGETGRLARAAGVRLSMHPSQFCVIASTTPSAVENGVAELEYHAEIMSLLGFGSGWHPEGAHINIHGGAKGMGAEGFRAGLERLSQTARNLVTVENDEVSYGLDDLLALAGDLPIVLDLHHHWIASRGEYIDPGDPRIARIVESWRGVRPLAHVSVSREELLADHDIHTPPDFAALVAAGIKPKDLRGHSDLMWNEAINDLVADHLAWADFEVEAKLKNIASEGLARHVEARWAKPGPIRRPGAPPGGRSGRRARGGTRPPLSRPR